MTDIFYGTKKVKAEPMTRAEYNAFRGWEELPADEDGEDPGYLVEYQDGGKPNVEGREGYVSWSPKEPFDKAYIPQSLIEANGPILVALDGVDVHYYPVPAPAHLPDCEVNLPG